LTDCGLVSVNVGADCNRATVRAGCHQRCEVGFVLDSTVVRGGSATACSNRSEARTPALFSGSWWVHRLSSCTARSGTSNGTALEFKVRAVSCIGVSLFQSIVGPGDDRSLGQSDRRLSNPQLCSRYPITWHRARTTLFEVTRWYHLAESVDRSTSDDHHLGQVSSCLWRVYSSHLQTQQKLFCSWSCLASSARQPFTGQFDCCGAPRWA